MNILCFTIWTQWCPWNDMVNVVQSVLGLRPDGFKLFVLFLRLFLSSCCGEAAHVVFEGVLVDGLRQMTSCCDWLVYNLHHTATKLSMFSHPIIAKEKKTSARYLTGNARLQKYCRGGSSRWSKVKSNLYLWSLEIWNSAFLWENAQPLPDICLGVFRPAFLSLS